MAEEYFGLTCQSLCDALSTLKGAYEATNTDFNLYWSVGEWGKGVHSISESVHVVLSDTISMLKHQQAEIERLQPKTVNPVKPLDVDDDYTYLCDSCKGELFCGDVLRDHFCPSCGGKVAWKDGDGDVRNV